MQALMSQKWKILNSKLYILLEVKDQESQNYNGTAISNIELYTLQNYKNNCKE